jgi:hypothetical protein
MIVRYLHDGFGTRNSTPTVARVNAPHEWRDRITSLAVARQRDAQEGGFKALRPIRNAQLTLPGLTEAIAPTSTTTGAALIHAARPGAAERLAAAGHVPDV